MQCYLCPLVSRTTSPSIIIFFGGGWGVQDASGSVWKPCGAENNTWFHAYKAFSTISLACFDSLSDAVLIYVTLKTPNSVIMPFSNFNYLFRFWDHTRQCSGIISDSAWDWSCARQVPPRCTTAPASTFKALIFGRCGHI